MRKLLAVTAALLLLAGCTKSGAKPGVATAQDAGPAASGSGNPATSDPAAPSTAPSAPLTDYDKALQYTRCMTAHGWKMNDPVVGQMLVTGYIVTVGETEQTYSQRLAAYHTCKHLLPETWPVKVTPDDELRDRPFFDCMGKRGFPTPKPDANGMVAFPTDGMDVYATDAYRAAFAVCRHLVDDPANNQ